MKKCTSCGKLFDPKGCGIYCESYIRDMEVLIVGLARVES
jgi:recombinational DNA repair protein RecR